MEHRHSTAQRLVQQVEYEHSQTCFFNIFGFSALSVVKTAFVALFPLSFPFTSTPGRRNETILHTVQLPAKTCIVVHPEACSHFPGFGALSNNMLKCIISYSKLGDGGRVHMC